MSAGAAGGEPSGASQGSCADGRRLGWGPADSPLGAGYPGSAQRPWPGKRPSSPLSPSAKRPRAPWLAEAAVDGADSAAAEDGSRSEAGEDGSRPEEEEEGEDAGGASEAGEDDFRSEEEEEEEEECAGPVSEAGEDGSRSEEAEEDGFDSEAGEDGSNYGAGEAARADSGSEAGISADTSGRPEEEEEGACSTLASSATGSAATSPSATPSARRSATGSATPSAGPPASSAASPGTQADSPSAMGELIQAQQRELAQLRGLLHATQRRAGLERQKRQRALRARREERRRRQRAEARCQQEQRRRQGVECATQHAKLRGIGGPQAAGGAPRRRPPPPPLPARGPLPLRPAQETALAWLSGEDNAAVATPLLCNVCSGPEGPYTFVVMGGSGEGYPFAVGDLAAGGNRQLRRCVVTGPADKRLRRDDILAAWPTALGAVVRVDPRDFCPAPPKARSPEAALWRVGPGAGWREKPVHYQLELCAAPLPVPQGDISALAVSRCGGCVAALVRRPPGTDGRKEAQLRMRHRPARFQPEAPLELCFARLGGPRTEWQAVQGEVPHDAHGLVMSSGGTRAAWFEPAEWPRQSAQRAAVVTIALEPGARPERAVREAAGVGDAPLLSPCGGFVFYEAGANPARPFTTHPQWWVKELGSQAAPRALTPSGRCIIHGCLGEDGALYVTYADGLQRRSARVAHRPECARVLLMRPIMPGPGVGCLPGVPFRVHAAESGTTLPVLVLTRLDAAGATEVLELPADNDERCWGPKVTAAQIAARVRVEQLAWAAPDGAEVSGVTFALKDLPSDAPLLVLAHQGPMAWVGSALRLAAGCPAGGDDGEYGCLRPLLAAGFRVLVPAYRGSQGFGDGWAQGAIGCQGTARGDLGDLVSGVRHVQRNGTVAGSARVGVLGCSYGGYLAMRALAEHPELFDAGVSVSGFTDHAAMAAISGDRCWSEEFQNAAGSNVDPDRIWRPLLLVHGADDEICPEAQSVAVWHSLTRRGVPCRGLFFRGEGHSLGSSARHDARKETVRWLLQYVPGADGAEAPRRLQELASQK